MMWEKKAYNCARDDQMLTSLVDLNISSEIGDANLDIALKHLVDLNHRNEERHCSKHHVRRRG
jgi:hypothetical protein